MEIGREMFQKESGLKRGVSSDWVFRKGKVSDRKWSQKRGVLRLGLGRERFQTESGLKRGVSSDWVFRKGKVSERKWSQKGGGPQTGVLGWEKFQKESGLKRVVLRLGFQEGKGFREKVVSKGWSSDWFFF